MFDEGQQATGGTTTPSFDGARLVIDSPLLFSGSYGRDGQDLVITGEGMPVRVPGYFADQAPQALYSPQGAVLRGETVELLAGPQAPGQYAQAGQNAAGVLAGKVGQLAGSATVQHADGTSEALAVDKQVFQGDVLQTGADGTLGVLFQDNTVLLLQPSSRIVVNEFVYDPNSTSNSATLDAVDGTFAFVAGKVAKTGGLDVVTPIATMGIRGTTGLCVALEAAAARCALGPDPNFEVGRIGIFDNATGAQFTTLTQIDVKLVLLSGALAVVDKTDQEIVFDELLVQQLHQLYADLGVPQSGPLQKINYDTGSPDFSVPVPGFGVGASAPLPLLIDTEPEQQEEATDQVVNETLLVPIGGSSTVGNLDETGLGTGSEQLTGVLPISFNAAGNVTFDFASLNGNLVLDSGGNVVTAGGVALRFVWNGASNTLFGMAGAVTVFAITLDPETGRFSAVLLAAIDHTGAGADLLFIPLTFTATVDDGRTGQGTLTIAFADDVPHVSVTSAQIGEANAVSGTWTLDAGADGVASLLVKVGGASQTLSLGDPANQVVFQLAQGTLIVHADGTWTFTGGVNLDNRVAQTVTFSLTATDGDGDPATAVSTIAITDGAPPIAVANELTLQLDEAALDAGDVRAGDDLGSQPDLETDHASGALTFTAGSDRLVDFVLDASKIEVRNELGGLIAVTWVGTGTGVLTGFVDGVAVIRISVDDATIEAFSTGDVAVAAQLLDNLRHVSDQADVIRITGLSVVARDIDGSAVASGGFEVTVADDSASIKLGDLPASVEEGQTVSGTYQITTGADGVGEITVSVSVPGQSPQRLDLSDPNNSVIFNTPEGVLTVFANRTWTFTASNNLDNDGSAIQFTLTARDGDDDTNSITASQVIDVIDGVGPSASGTANAVVDEKDLPDGSVAGGPTAVDPDTQAQASGATFTAGSDPITITFDLAAGQPTTGTGLDGEVTWERSPDGLTLTGFVGGVAAIMLVLSGELTAAAGDTATPTVTVRLLDAFPHDATPNVGSLTISGIGLSANDPDGDSASANISVTVLDDLPAGGQSASVALDEDGLAGGNSGGTGDLDPTTNGPIVKTGTLVHDYGADGAGQTLLTGVTLPQGLGLSVGSNTGTELIVSQLQGGVMVDVLAIRLADTTSGAFTVTQLHAIDHPLAGTEDSLQLSVSYEVTDGDGDKATGSLSISVNDDSPAVAPIVKTINDLDTNVLLILDRSGSMNTDPGVPGYATRLELLKAAANELLDKYAELGDVRVQLVVFSDTATKPSSVWMTVSAAKTLINGLTSGGATDYDDATALAPDAFNDAGKLDTAGVRNVAYFISDGAPNPTSDAVEGGELTSWTNFLNSNDIVSHAIGIGSSAPDTYLDPIAYDGRGAGTNTDATIVTDLSQLQSTLVATVSAPVSGTLIESTIPTGFGADGGYVKGIAVGGSTYTYDAIANSILVTGTNNSSFDAVSHRLTIAFPGSAGESFVIDLDDGSYSYTAPSLFNTNFSRLFSYTLSDSDGDTGGSTLTIKVGDAGATGGQGGGSDLAAFALAAPEQSSDAGARSIPADDHGETHHLLATSAADDLNGGDTGTDIASYANSTSEVLVNLNDSGSAATNMTGDTPQNGEVGGDAAGDKLAGIEGLAGGSGDDYLAGNGSDNTLLGGAGNDTLIGEGGNDLLYGGAGQDTLSGGGGGDTFVIDAAALAEMGVFDVIADYESGVDMIDLSGIFTSLGISDSNEVAAALQVTFSDGAAHVAVDTNGSAAEGLQEVASLASTGPGAVISIIYDQNQPAHDTHTT